jgi:orotate phosphoribosyltransferase
MKTLQHAHLVATTAIENGFYKFNFKTPFTWSAGHRMPLYMDNRLFLHHMKHRKLIHEAFKESIKELIREEGVHFEVVIGVATAGIAWGVLISNEFGFRYAYVRGEPKKYGMKNLIEGLGGDLNLKGARVLVIEDVISTGASAAKAVQDVRDAGGECEHLVSIFNYGFKEAEDRFAQMDPPCKVRSILNYQTLVQIMREKKYLDEVELKDLQEWRTAPYSWGEERGFERVIKEKV